MYILGANMYI